MAQQRLTRQHARQHAGTPRLPAAFPGGGPMEDLPRGDLRGGCGDTQGGGGGGDQATPNPPTPVLVRATGRGYDIA